MGVGCGVGANGPGVVLRVPAMMPLKPHALAMSLNALDLQRARDRARCACACVSERGEEGGADALGRDPAAPGEQVQRDALAEEQMPRAAADGGHVLHGLEHLSLIDVPFDPNPRA